MVYSYRSGREEPRNRYPLWWQPFHRCLDDGGGSLRKKLPHWRLQSYNRNVITNAVYIKPLSSPPNVFVHSHDFKVALCLLPTGEIDAKQRSKESERTHQCVPEGVLCTYYHTSCLLGRMLRGTMWNSKRHPKISENFGQMRFWILCATFWLSCGAPHDPACQMSPKVDVWLLCLEGWNWT